jgi:transcriptional regulator with XRE-family HTH domain
MMGSFLPLHIGLPIPTLLGNQWDIMDWKTVIADLQEAGLSQLQIARECEASQPTISELATGKTVNPSWKLGEALRKLHAERMALPAGVDPIPPGPMRERRHDAMQAAKIPAEVDRRHDSKLAKLAARGDI